MPDGNTTTASVFVSYRRSDSAPYARLLYDALAEHIGRQHVFYDIDSIAPGRDFVEVLTETLERVQVLLVVIGRNWVNANDAQGRRRIDDPGDYVRMEIERALGRRDLRGIPVLVAGATMPDEHALPESLAPLSRRKAMTILDDHWRATITDLLDTIDRVADELLTSQSEGAMRTSDAVLESTTDGNRLRPKSPGKVMVSRFKRRKFIVAAVAIVLVILLIGVVAAFGHTGHRSANPPSEPTSTSTLELAPNVVGQQIAQARTILAAAEFNVVETQEKNAAPEGIVLSEHVDGNTVTLVVSAGPSAIRVPAVVGRPYLEAVLLLKHAGFEVRAVLANSGLVPRGDVISSGPTGAAAKGATITLIVSSGPAASNPAHNGNGTSSSNQTPGGSFLSGSPVRTASTPPPQTIVSSLPTTRPTQPLVSTTVARPHG